MAKSRSKYLQKQYTNRRYTENFAEYNLTKRMYEDLLCNIVSSMYIWDIPPELSENKFIDSKYIETNLLNYSLACAISTDFDVPILLPFNAFSDRNIYGEFKEIQLFSIFNGATFTAHLPNYATICDYNLGNIRNIINYYSDFFTCIDMTQNINLNTQKTPFIITAEDDNQKLAIKNVFAEIDGYKNAVAVDKFFDKSAINVIKFDSPFLSDKLQEIKNAKILEFMSWIGIPVPLDKKERLNNSESLQNLALPLAGIYARMENRLSFCEKAKKRLHLDFNVRYNDHILSENGFLEMFTAIKRGDNHADNDSSTNSSTITE